MTRARSILHLLAHLAGLNVVQFVVFRRHGYEMAGLRCDACGRISDVHVATTREIREALDDGPVRVVRRIPEEPWPRSETDE